MSALLELLRAKKQDLAAGNRRKTIKPLDGNNRFRILPSWRGEGEQQFFHDFAQHFVKNAAKELTAIYMCTAKTFGKPCSICDAIGSGIKADVDPFTTELLKDARSTGRVLLNVTHMEKEPDEVQILEIPPSVFKQIIDIATEYEEAGESIFNLKTGKDILIGRSGAGKLTKYTVMVAAKSLPVPATTMSKVHNLDDYVQQESSEQALRALNSVRAVTGLLAAPPRSSGLPAAADEMGAASLVDDDPYAAAPPPTRRVTPVADVVDIAPKVIGVAAPVTASAAPPASNPGDDELAALLASLGETS